MERVNVVVLASLAAALTLLGIRLLSDRAGPNFLTRPADASSGPLFGPGAASDRRLPRSRIAMHGGLPGERGQPPRMPTPGAEKRRESRTGASDSSTDLIAGVERRRDILRGAYRDEFDAGELPGRDDPDLLAGRSAAVPRGASQPQQPNQPDVVEPEPQPEPGGADVLMRIPFNGSIDAEVGGGTWQAEGLVTGDGMVEFPEDGRLSFPSSGNVHSDSGTIAFDVQPRWSGTDESNNSLVQIRNEHIWENTLSIVKNFDSLRFIIIDSSGVESNVNIPIGDWTAGEMRSLTATWNHNSMALYVDGILVGQNSLPSPLNFSDTAPMYIGSDFPGSTYAGAGGTIRDFVVYGRALGADEVTRQ
jgi:hypothetical protein